jgi:hypothetical protein
VGHVALMGAREMHTGFWWERQKIKDDFEDQDFCGWIQLKWILERIGRYRLHLSAQG